MEYSSYIIAAYGISLVSLAYLLYSSLKKYRKVKRDYERLKPKQPVEE